MGSRFESATQAVWRNKVKQVTFARKNRKMRPIILVLLLVSIACRSTRQAPVTESAPVMRPEIAPFNPNPPMDGEKTYPPEPPPMVVRDTTPPLTVEVTVAPAPEPEAKVDQDISTPPIPAPPTAASERPAPPVIVVSQPNYALYDSLLRTYVTSAGKVNYVALKRDRALLDAVVADFSAQNPAAEDWQSDQKKAFWINAYNVFTLDLVVRNYPLSSITKLDKGKTWDVRRITINGEKYSLNQIENDILRPQYQDGRIHFAVNCAARSCPPLLNRAYLPEMLDEQLDAQTRKFVRSKYNDLSADVVKVSKIFDWYARDFGNLINFLNRYATVKINKNARIEYLEYDWSLNGM
jgi:hypothetical protein